MVVPYDRIFKSIKLFVKVDKSLILNMKDFLR